MWKEIKNGEDRRVIWVLSMRGSICSHNLVRCGLFWFICKWLNEVFLKATMMSLLCYQFAAKSLQSCPTLCVPRDGSPPGSPSLGFSRQEHWSGLPFPSPMQESEKWKWSRSVVSDSERPHGLQPTRLLPPWDFPGKSTGVGRHCLLHRLCLHHLKNKNTLAQD